MKKVLIGIGIGILAYVVVLGTIIGVYKFRQRSSDVEVVEEEEGSSKGGKKKKPESAFTSILNIDYENEKIEYTPQVPEYQVNADCSNVLDFDRYYFDDEQKRIFSQNNFIVKTASYDEMFEIYETNRYWLQANFVTTDSMLHTYHLYFAMLQKNCEKNYLSRNMRDVSEKMLKETKNQYRELEGTEWEEASKRAVAFFAVACVLSGADVDIPSYVEDIVEYEVGKIYEHSAIDSSMITEGYEDYSQYVPRGYYEGDEELEKYFRTMMWYGRTNFAQDDETLNRCACLISLAMTGSVQELWKQVYDVTSFFAGASDDNGYGEYMPIINKAFGKDIEVEDLIGDKKGYEKYEELTAQLDPPAINSVVYDDDGGETDKTEISKGFRFMGQRFTLDAAIFTNLTYSKTKPASDGSKRMLPDALDVPAALGSEVAREILIENGNDKYEGYTENLDKVSRELEDATEDLWTSSLYGGWMNTLNPLLEEKGEGYPSFMTNKEWAKKSIETYLGSWTELKHDTILYSKQMVAEMGGDDPTNYDDRGYVEPEPEVFGRLAALTNTTANGLDRYGVISSEDKENLLKLGDLAKSLQKIAVKELNNEDRTDAEYDLIREYGGNLEHFWRDTIKDQSNGDEWVSCSEFPMALVADVATDPNGTCLEEAIGGGSVIYVAFPLDGQIHIASGSVFTYYQFEQPLSNRLTDSSWRQMLGMELEENMEYNAPKYVPQPEWTQSYRSTYIPEHY